MQMKQIILQFALVLLFIEEVLTYGFQFSTKKWFQKGAGSISAGDTDGWSLSSSNAYYKTCSGTVTELLNRDLFVLRSGYSISKTYTGLPPHWSVGVRFDLVVGVGGSGCLYIDTQPQPCYYYYSYSNSYAVCTSTAENFQRVYSNYTHNSPTMKLDLYASGDLILSLVEIYLDRCHSSCLKCSGPTANQCTQCDPTSSPVSGGKCQCPTGKYMLDGKCYNPCPSGYIKNPDTTQQTCIIDYCSSAPENVYCGTCKSSTFCTQCKLGYFYYMGQCVATCPPDAPKDSTGVCKDPTVGKWNAKYLVYELFSKTFSESEIVGAKFQINAPGRFYGANNWSKFTDCGDYRFFAGYNIYGPGSQINYSFTLPAGAKYSSFLISFLFGQIDNYEKGEYVNFVITNSGGQELKRQSITGNGKDLICGRKDQQELFQYQYINVTVTTPDTYSLTITNSLGQIENESFGMREFIVIVDYCIDNCTKCQDQAGCVQCDSGYYLYKSQCFKDRCPDGSFEDKSNPTPRYCSSCHESCKTCQGAGPNNCLTCFDGIYLKTNSCVANCGDQFYPATQTCTSCQVLICNPCYKPCLRCTGGKYNQCQACINGYYLDSDKSECVSVCQDRFYPNSSTNTCDPCDIECFNCKGPNNNQCTQCELPRFLLGTECKLNCPSGYFGNKKTCTCDPCTSPCAECVDSATKCTKCDKPNLYLDDFQCVLNCQNKKYKDDATMRCEKCNIQCGNCTGPFSNQCTSCDLEDGFLLDTTCVQDCGDGYFPVSDPAYVCSKCHKSCKTCKSPGLNTSCTSCNNQYLTPQGQCMDTCPIGYYQDPSIYLCKQCHETCETCSDQYSISCLTCRPGRYYLNGLCVTICPSNTFPLDLKGCQPCHPSCATCNGYFPQNCQSCKLGNYLQNGTCVQTCTTGYYGNNETGTCSQCHPYCASCYGKEVYECMTCNKGYSLSGSTCGSNCPAGQYQDTNLNQCSNCHFECYTCGGPDKNDCTGCKGERYLDQQLHFCDSSCPEKTFKGANNICQPCHATCGGCIGNTANDCIKCNQGSYLYNNQCVLACPDGYFSTEQPFLCNKCHQSCAQCQFGAQDSDCTQCAGNYYLDGAKCVQACPKGSFGSTKPNQCLPCHSSCAECSGPNYNQCTTCQDKTYKFQNICQTECPKGYQPSQIQKECIKCEEGCNSCSVQDPAICLSCQQGTYLHQNKCTSQCPDGTYVGVGAVTNPNRLLSDTLIIDNDSLKSQQICLNCADDCRKCTGSFKQDCTQWFDEREVNYAEYRIFWIFFGKTVFCIVGILAGFYLDYKDEVSQEEKLNNPMKQNQEEEKQKMIQQNNAKIFPINGPQSQQVSGLLPVLPQIQDKHSNINEIETVKSYQKHEEKGSPQVDEKDLMNNTNTKKRQRLDLNYLQNNSLKYNQLNKNTELNFESDQTKGLDIDFLFHPNTLSTQNNNLKQSNNKLSINALENKDEIINPGTQAQIVNNDQIQNENQNTLINKQKSPILAFFIFFEVTQLFLYKNVNFMRPVRVLIYYSKLLFIFFITSFFSNIDYYLIGFCMFGLLLTVKLLHSGIMYLGVKFQTMIMLCFAVFIVLVFLHIKMFMFPEIARISFPQDISWSNLYIYTFLADLGLFQIVYLIIQIIITYDFSSQHIIKYDIFHRILKMIFFKDLLKKWLDEKDN
ncbi:hypothetical protein TTHERM_01006490 (macronuclear) [Tetrahymena thermophila SB210]|uniref:EGF-like domain-containing protein n=1 Tax=Tetrahymena thermophila (strain SB210) TaxID=312017 RepID=X1W3T8_TETTS|nr:hypothetical protein TTHERM_01006490 [Tetrahymena thermophila SB210]EAR83178.2 hypothetical protein TTHERM_01006490 [Tetrahymena thermophila SB210]|eukprot:XP_001030841.2 hypothetical protein TTHERM_01006490 [Tetrahymena thermophila SB210]